MNVLVAYFTQTGNTRKVAEAIHEEMAEPKEIKELAAVESLEAHDLSFIGFPIMAFGPAKPAKEFLAAHAAGKKVALFITHASPEDSEPLEEWLAACKEAAADADLVGVFNCRGELAESIAELLAQSDDPQMRAFADGRSETLGQPDEARLEKARAFAREIIEKLKG
jgi:flavodoxin